VARRATATKLAEATPEAALAMWKDSDRWPSFVEGCARVIERDGGWPEVGSWVVWRSHTGGRGTVREEVVASPPSSFATRTLDSSVVGTQTLSAVLMPGAGAELTLDLEYELVDASVFQATMDWVFIRRALRDSLRRTLARFAEELAVPAE
jgi:hypothetical protein